MLVASLTPVIAAPQLEMRFAEITLANGCKLEWPRLFNDAKLASDRAQFKWEGACLNNMVQGQGVLFEISDFGNFGRSIIETRTTFHEGRNFGYSLRSTRREPKSDYTDIFGSTWSFRGDGGDVSFSADGAGIVFDTNPFDSTTALPMPASFALKTWSLQTRTKTAHFIAATCDQPAAYAAREESFCANKPGLPVFFTVVYERSGDINVEVKSKRIVPCPDPHSLSGCNELIERIGTPLRDEILLFIEKNRPANDALLARMNAAPQEDRERRAAQQQKVIEEERAFQAGLQRMNPGQLYALADKSLAESEPGKAREVLRTLIVRFPDHALSVTASQQLAGLSEQPTSTAKPTVPTAVPAAAECRNTLGFLAQRFPDFSATELNGMRSAVVGQSVLAAISGAKAQGYSQDNAVRATLAQAKEFDRVSRESAQCAADVDAMGASDEDFLAAMRQGRAPSNCSGIRNACLCAGIVNRISAVGARALAAEMQCFARSGKW